MSVTNPWFYAWCDEVDRLDAFAAALSALIWPGGLCGMQISPLGHPSTDYDALSVEEAIAAVRGAFGGGTMLYASFNAALSAGRWLSFNVDCYDDVRERRYPSGPLCARPDDQRDLLVDRLEIASSGGARAVEVEAAILSMQVQQDTEDLLIRLCAPDARARVTTGCVTLGDWYAPIETCATYNADAKVARDLALSWVHLYEGELVACVVGMSLDALTARVEAAPHGARIGVAINVEGLDEHAQMDRAAAKSRDARPTRVDAARHGVRAILPGDAELTREQVLAALSTPPATLLEALEASAVPDDEWRAVEPRALAMIEAKKQGAPTCEVNVSTGKHTRFIQHHAPYHVRRLPGGGVLLATHSYRILWPLWADALMLLGITP